MHLPSTISYWIRYSKLTLRIRFVFESINIPTPPLFFFLCSAEERKKKSFFNFRNKLDLGPQNNRKFLIQASTSRVRVSYLKCDVKTCGVPMDF